MLKERKNLKLSYFLGLFMFLAFVMWCTPFSSDDYEFAMLDIDGFSGLASYALHYGNGRVFGNMLGVCFAQIPILAVVVKALIIASVIMLLPEALGLHSNRYYIISFILLIAINPNLFGEVYTWSSGFSNYIPPIWLTLIILCCIRHFSCVKHTFIQCSIVAIVFLLGIASQLFVEHSTIINLLLSFFTTVKCARRKDGSWKLPAVWFVAAFIGALLMLLVPSIFYVPGNRAEGYRSVNIGSISTLLFSCYLNTFALLDNYTGTLGIVVCIGAILTLYLTHNKRSSKTNCIFYALSIFSLVYLALSAILSIDVLDTQCAPSKFKLLHRIFSGAISCTPFVVWIVAARNLDNRENRNRLLYLLTLAIISLAMFAIVTPVPSRAVFQSYLLIVLAVLICAASIEKRINKRLKAFIDRAAVIIACVLVLLLSVVFYCCHEMAIIREQSILQQIDQGETTIEIFEIPYGYVFSDTVWCYNYYYYNEEPHDVQFVSIEYDQWIKEYKNSIGN